MSNIDDILGAPGRPKIYAGSTHNINPQCPSFWKSLVDPKRYDIEFKAYQVAIGIRKLSDAHAYHEARIQMFKVAQLDAMKRIEMRIRERIIRMYKQDQTHPECLAEIQGAVSDASIYLKAETILNVLIPTSQRLKHKLMEYEKFHVQLTLGNELDSINRILGNLSSGVDLQSVVDKVMVNTERFADATALDSTLADASSELESATNAIGNMGIGNSPEKLITDMIAKMMLSDQLAPVPSNMPQSNEEKMVFNKLKS